MGNPALQRDTGAGEAEEPRVRAIAFGTRPRQWLARLAPSLSSLQCLSPALEQRAEPTDLLCVVTDERTESIAAAGRWLSATRSAEQPTLLVGPPEACAQLWVRAMPTSPAR